MLFNEEVKKYISPELLLSGDHQSVNQKHIKCHTAIQGYASLDPKRPHDAHGNCSRYEFLNISENQKNICVMLLCTKY